MAAFARTPSPAVAADLAVLPDELRAEIVAGEIVHRASPSFEHGDAQSSLGSFLKDPFQRGRGGPGGWWIATEVEVELETHDVYVPDAIGWRRERVPERPRGRPVRVRPDWVCEILSPSTAGRDLGTKLPAYHRAGVPHAWLIDTGNETLSIYRWQADGYTLVRAASPGDVVNAEPFEALPLEVATLFGA